MVQPERFDVLVLGSGTAGKLIAWHMARSGQRTAVVERQWIGGARQIQVEHLPWVAARHVGQVAMGSHTSRHCISGVWHESASLQYHLMRHVIARVGIYAGDLQ